MKTPVTRIYSSMNERSEHAEGSVQARIALDLERFNNVMLLPGVVEQVRGQLYCNWGYGFLVELDDPEPVVGWRGPSLPSATVFFEGPLDALEVRVAAQDWTGGPCPNCQKVGVKPDFQINTDETRWCCPSCKYRWTQRY